MWKRFSCGLLVCAALWLTGQSHADAGTYHAETNYDMIVPASKKYIGVPYQWGGTTARGFDCSGFIRHVYQTLDVNVPRTTSEMYETGTSVKKEDLRVGDIVFFNTNGKGVSHAGIYIGENQFIHSSSSKGVTVSSLNDPYYWGKKYIGARRVLSYPLEPGKFRDIAPSYWAADEIRALSEDELLIGYENGYFKPDEPITRAEVMADLAEYLNLDFSDRSAIFRDVPSEHWAVGAVNAMYKNGYVNGSNGSFHPEDTLTRAQLAKILTNVFDLKQPAVKRSFTDVPDSHWAYPYIQALAASGITTGYSDGSFRPDDTVTRAQFAAFLYRGMNK
ncbi:S-layer family protein [Anoxybacillus vitaminiphilus]|uniref:S-layer family protein n=1 Tax=Paranoxybacillus vitaminiphilus TaxID=581036 RepID=A0A327YHN2_9BACL|nr:C40 family peptidase [Anoxybacillus vitaminiphilus]RAK19857.1 S-layer family protein [Anoxybacillus vitaminiphilus]